MGQGLSGQPDAFHDATLGQRGVTEAVDEVAALISREAVQLLGKLVVKVLLCGGQRCTYLRLAFSVVAYAQYIGARNTLR